MIERINAAWELSERARAAAALMTMHPGYIVEIEEGVWLARVKGDPVRTLVRAKARVYSRWQDARCALTWAQKVRPFPNARILTKDNYAGA